MKEFYTSVKMNKWLLRNKWISGIKYKALKINYKGIYRFGPIYINLQNKKNKNKLLRVKYHFSRIIKAKNW